MSDFKFEIKFCSPNEQAVSLPRRRASIPEVKEALERGFKIDNEIQGRIEDLIVRIEGEYLMHPVEQDLELVTALSPLFQETGTIYVSVPDGHLNDFFDVELHLRNDNCVVMQYGYRSGDLLLSWVRDGCPKMWGL